MIVVKIVLVVYAAVCLAQWLWWAYCAFRMRHSVPYLDRLETPAPPHWPKVSVVVPACDEADKLPAAARTLLEIDYPDLEIVLVDDRSTDETPRIVDELAAGDGRVRAVHVTELPEGWLGKVHALQRGLDASSGELVLFTDADVHFGPAALRRAVAYFRQEELDYLTAFPSLWPTHLLLDAGIAIFIRHLIGMVRPWALADARSRAHMGVGAFGLVRRAALAETNGLEWLRMEAADDAGLALLMKRSGARCRLINAFADLKLHWYRSMDEAARGAEKGFASAAGCSFARTVLLAAWVVLVELSPLAALAPLASDELHVVGLCGLPVLAAFLLCAVLMSRWARGKLLPGLAAPLAGPLVAAMLLRAGWLGRRRGGVAWRGTLYPAEALRRGRRIRFP